MTVAATTAVPWLREVQAGLTAALVLLPVHGSYGVIALAPLGPAHAATGFLMGVFAAVLVNLVMVLGGDRGPMAAGPSAALSLLVPPLLVQLLAVPALRGPGGEADATTMVALMGLGVALAGVLQWLLGWMRWGAVARYVPYPVHGGFMLGVAALMVLAMVPHALGLPSGQRLWEQDPLAIRPLAPLVAVVAAAATLASRRWRPRWPALLLGLVAGMALHHALAAAGAGAVLGAVLGPIEFVWPDPDVPQRLVDGAIWAQLPQVAEPLGWFAVAVALTAAMQALMAGSVVSSMTGVPCDGDRLLRGQGLAGLAGGLLGLSPAAGSVASTAVALTAGGRGTLSRVASALGLLLALAIGVVLLQQMAMAAVAGIFLVVARDLVDPWTGQTLSRVLRGRNPGPGAAATVGVLALVATISIGVSLVAGVLAGSLAAVLLFVRGQLRPPVRRVLRGDQLPSRTLRLPAVAAKLRVLARRIVCVELDGALFFGTADAAARAIAQAAVEADHVVLDCRRVREIDASGARVLLQLASSLRARDCRLVLASVAPAGRQALHLLDTRGLLPETAFLADADRALAHAEDAALAAAGVGQDGDGAVLPLAQTLWGQGLDADAVARLESSLEQLDVPAGTAVFRGGEVSDAMYVVLAGQVAIVLPGRADGMLRTHAQRLVSFAPGAFFGEAGVLRGEPRSADAVVERDARLARLDAAELSRLATEFPALHVHLLRAMALHLADRLGALTLAWQALDDAPAAGPAPEATPVETIAQADDQRW